MEDSKNLDKILDKRKEVVANNDYVNKARTFGVKVLNHGDHMHFKHKVDSYTGMIEDYKKNIDSPNPCFGKNTINLKIKNGRGKWGGPQSSPRGSRNHSMSRKREGDSNFHIENNMKKIKTTNRVKSPKKKNNS